MVKEYHVEVKMEMAGMHQVKKGKGGFQAEAAAGEAQPGMEHGCWKPRLVNAEEPSTEGGGEQVR